MKKTLSFLLAIVVIITLSVPAFASSDSDINSAIVSAVNSYVSDMIGTDGALSNTNDISYMAAINAYEYVNGAFNKLDFELYPIIAGAQIVAYATVYESAEGLTVAQITKGNTFQLSIGSSAVILYDCTACYTFDGTYLRKNSENAIAIDYRDDLTQIALEDLNELVLSPVANATPISISHRRSSIVYTCSVPIKSQLIDANGNTVDSSDICWAASIASIGQYLVPTINKTAVEVAQYVFGSDYNHGASTQVSLGALSGIYDVIYGYFAMSPTSSKIVSNLSAGYPMFGSFTYSDGRHAVVIYSINLTDGYIRVMDPQFGYQTCYLNSSGVYSYVSVASGVLLTADHYGGIY